MANFVRAFFVVTVIITATFLPFAAGGYDPLARPLATMAWILGRVGLLLVPLGGLWLWAAAKRTTAPRWLMRLTLCTYIVIELVLVLIAFASGVLLAVGTAVIAALLTRRLARHLRATAAEPPLGRRLALILIIAPIVVLCAQSALVNPATTYGRNRVIANAAPLIAEIEQYRVRNGAYPVSLFSLYGDYKPSLVGVQRYHYEMSGAAYNVIFEEPALGFGMRRFVVYNPRDKQRVTVHEQDRLQLNEAELDADNVGHTLIEPLPQPHWKVFIFLS